MTFDPEERAQRAMTYFREGYNCTQSVVLAFSDFCEEKGVNKEALASLTSGFGGGMARMREVCGTVSGMTFLAGLISPATNPSIREERTANYKLVQEFAQRFREQNGSIVCRDLLQMKASSTIEGPQPSERTEAFYKARPCERLIGRAAMIVAEYLKQQSATFPPSSQMA